MTRLPLDLIRSDSPKLRNTRGYLMKKETRKGIRDRVSDKVRNNSEHTLRGKRRERRFNVDRQPHPPARRMFYFRWVLPLLKSECVLNDTELSTCFCEPKSTTLYQEVGVSRTVSSLKHWKWTPGHPTRESLTLPPKTSLEELCLSEKGEKRRLPEETWVLTPEILSYESYKLSYPEIFQL